MKKIFFLTLIVFSVFTGKAQLDPNSWDPYFDGNDLRVEVDHINGYIRLFFTKHYNNTGCQWWLQSNGPSQRMHIQIRKIISSPSWHIIAHGDLTNGISERFVPINGATVGNNGYYDISYGPDIRNLYEIQFTNLDPSYFSEPIEIQVAGYWTSTGCIGNTGFVAATQTFNLGPMGTPSNLTATSQCNQVKLDWNNNIVTNLHCDVFRDGSYIATVGPNIKTYTDTGATPGQNHNYEVRNSMHWNNPAPARYYNSAKISVQGATFPAPEDPKNMFVDQVNCNGALEVNWSWSASTNPDRFEIQRSADSNFVPNQTTSFTTSGSDRFYRDLTSQVGQAYYYRVMAQDDCPTSGVINSTNPPTELQAGLGIPSAPSGVSLQVDTIGKKITVNWSDNSTMEDGFKVVRQSSTGQVEFDVAENATSYVDNSALTCETYTYSIKSYNTCKTTGVLSSGPTGSASAYIPTNLGSVFNNTNYKLNATDGEFGDRVELRWNTNNNQIDFWNIDRINPQTNDTVQIASLSGRISVYADQTANANTLYKYIITGETNCAGSTEYSNPSEDYGFRLSFGTVNGQITYSGGVAVEGVKVNAEPSVGVGGNSGSFNGTTAYALVKAAPKLHTNAFTIQTYLKMNSTTGSHGIVSKSASATTGFEYKFVNNNLELRIGNQTFSSPLGSINPSSWFSATVTVSSDSVKFYINDSLTTQVTHSVTNFSDSAANLLIGKLTNGSYLNGNIDELRFFSSALNNTQVKRSYDVYINPSMLSLVGYWRFDEGFGNVAYDYSKTLLTPNKNNAVFSGVSFANDKPTSSQLSAGAYTDHLGSYFIPFIPYQGSGDNFILTPTFGVHTFSPATTTLLIGQGSTNYTGQNFLDNSSFRVTGTVKYDSTACFVKDARLLIDGEVVVRNGQVVQTNQQGFFDIQVPIGPHVVSVEKTSHDFKVGRFPTTGAYDFQAPVSNIEFIDSTLVKVVGRVAGGSIQRSLPVGLGRGKNNIGQANIPFKAQQGNGCLVESVLTDINTGEYSISLPPLRYEVPNFNIISNQAIQFNNNNLLDIANVPAVQRSEDSVFIEVNGQQVLSHVDSIQFQKQLDFIHYVNPSIGVVGKDNPAQYGEDTLYYEGQGSIDSIPTAALGLSYPVFEENSEYTWLISAFEIYENKDGGNSVLDSVPMKEGAIEIVNNLSADITRTYEYKITDSIGFTGIQEYTFQGGQANTAANTITPSYSFTKTAEITLRPNNGNAVIWEPNTSDPVSRLFRGVVFGGKALGSSFATAGPQVVTMVLRDPPGSGSFSTWGKETTHSTTNSFNIEAAAGLQSKLKLSSGVSFITGLGYATETEVKASVTKQIAVETSVNSGGDFVENTTYSVDISTGTGDEFVGADGDLFFGRSYNMDFGLAENIGLVETVNCSANGNTCYGSPFSFNGKTYQIGSSVGMFVIPGGYGTEFVFTQSGIENSTIPKLVSLRDNLLLNHPDYNSHLSPGHANYGKSNDDLVFGNLATADPLLNSIEDSTGQSYTFTGYTLTLVPTLGNPIQVWDGVDSVWWYNQQIRLWVQALENNEKEKVLATSKIRNVSYQGGSVITYSNSTTRDSSNTTSFSINLTKELAGELGGEVGGIGATSETSAKFSLNSSGTFVRGTATTTSFSYTFDDSDPADEFSVDVYNSPDGYGPIFKTRGGQTSCPYQGEKKTKYYQPGAHTLDNATIQLEDPGISASPSTLFNVPSDAAANFTLNLSHGGPYNNVYEIRILENTNPYGAILEIDGLPPARDYAIPARSTIVKTLTVEKGPNHIKYDSIGIALISKCQYAYNTPGFTDIADTVYISVEFLPSCTKPSIQAPQNQFVANNSYSNSLPVVISGYDINYSGLENIELQYKPSNQASWVPLPTEWFKDTTDINTRYPNHVAPLQIPRNQSYITYQLAMDQLIDQDYDLRTSATCKIPFNPDHTEYSSVISGIFDRVNPHPFGTPTPADGVLDPNDDISITFNEDIESGSLTRSNFQITGVLNGGTLRNDIAVNFDGFTGYMEIDDGFDFTTGDFTVEFWAKRSMLGTEQVIISQGVAANNNFSIYFTSDNKIALRAGNFNSVSNFTVLDTSTWRHYSISYDQSAQDLEFINRFSSNSVKSTDNNFFHAFQSGGKTYIGKSAVANTNYLDASIHELRIWSRYMSDAEISSKMGVRLNGREAGLIAYYPMNEGRGGLARDVARFRHAQMKAEWELNPKSTAAQLNGINQYVSVDSAGTLATTQEMDLSLEFWFKTSGGRLQTMLSNGSGRFGFRDVNRNGWNIEMNAQNEIWVKNDSVAFKAVDRDFADNNWHHFALVVNRLANTTAYIDGVQQNSIVSSNFYGFSGAKMMIGARYYLNGTLENVDQYFDGSLDEIRVWNKALLRDNIEVSMFNRLNGDEFGLLAYYPFENYQINSGVPILNPALSNESKNGSNPSRMNATAQNGSVYSSQSPAIALQRPVESVNYSWSVNGDKIVITPNDPPSRIENVTLTVSVKDVKDLHGNVMQSPKSWIAFVNKNQVLWQDQQRNLVKEFNDTMTFISRVVNSGGDAKNFTISNIPPWLTAVPSTGTIQPQSSQTIKFTVNRSINIGDYSVDLLLGTDFGYDEKLLVNLKVRKTAPNFSFNQAQYSKSMSIVGQIEINNIVSTNDEDILVAYAGNQIRGSAQLQYVPALDRYLAFLNIYANNSADSIQFKVWNSRRGELHEDVTPEIKFQDNGLVGSLLNPQVFSAIDKIAMPIALRAGWNWVSFPLYEAKMRSFTTFLNGLNFANGDQVKTIGHNAVATYGGSAFGWSGNLNVSGLNNENSYLIHISNPDTIDYKGLAMDADTVPIEVLAGWNRIGFVSTKNMDINTALANYNATDGDLIKSQTDFAIYLSSLGWLGNLTALEPAKGYLIKSAQGDTFTYPRSSLFRLKGESIQPVKDYNILPNNPLNPAAFELSSNMIIQLNTCDQIIEDENWVLLAMVNGKLRGISEKAIAVEGIEKALHFMTAYGDETEQFDFFLYNKSDKNLLKVKGKIDFNNDAVQGDLNKAIVLDLEFKQDCKQFEPVSPADKNAIATYAYPNPFTNALSISIPEEIKIGALVQIIDQHSKVVFETRLGDQIELKLNGGELDRLSSGVYQLKFIDGDHLVTEKLVKLK